MLGKKNGEWQKPSGMCVSIAVIVIIIVVVILVIVVVVFLIMRSTRKAKAVGGVKGKKVATVKPSAPKKDGKTVKV